MSAQGLCFYHRGRGLAVLAAACMLGLVCAPSRAVAQYNMPFNRYLASLKTREGDARIEAFARQCLATAYPKAKREYLYTEGANWIPTPDIDASLGGYTTGDATTAQLWLVNGVPRAIYLWEVDLEYQRDTLFCMDAQGHDVVHALSRFFPSASGEPREHWVFVRSTHPGPRVNTWETVEHYEDAHGAKLEHPVLSAEDKDFMKGERVYHYWNDFDFSQQIMPDKTLQQPGAAK